jgi:glycosyltransferase involved in cell wall biosynthesis
VRIGLDARHAARGLGIGTFVTNLARHLSADQGQEIVWFGDAATAPEGVAAVVDIRLPYPILDTSLGRLVARRARVDVIHLTGNTGWRRSGNPAIVLTVHDLLFFAASRRARRPRQMVGHRYERWNIPRALAAANIVAVPSATVARQLRERFPHIPVPRVIHNGVELPDRVRPKVDPPYIVAFAGRDPRKRTKELLQVLRQLDGVGLRLLTSGGLPPGFVEEAAPELSSGRLELLSHVPRETLFEILGGARALLYPSDDEGFGLPVLEGLAAGTPVVAGLAPSTREIGADAIIRIDPADPVASMAAAVRKIDADADFAAALIQRGRERARSFAWQDTAARYAELYQEAVTR